MRTVEQGSDEWTAQYCRGSLARRSLERAATDTHGRTSSVLRPSRIARNACGKITHKIRHQAVKREGMAVCEYTSMTRVVKQTIRGIDKGLQSSS